MSQAVQHSDYGYILDILKSGDAVQLTELAQAIADFPDGIDPYTGCRWICHAVACGSQQTLEWMLSYPVDLTFQEIGGYTVLHTALERAKPDRYAILELLLKHGAPINAHGLNDWTPAHMAAVQEDIKALKLLIQYGADLTRRTRIDRYATPLEEAQILQKMQSVQFLLSERFDVG